MRRRTNRSTQHGSLPELRISQQKQADPTITFFSSHPLHRFGVSLFSVQEVTVGVIYVSVHFVALE
jgi:hypothetical protein